MARKKLIAIADIAAIYQAFPSTQHTARQDSLLTSGEPLPGVSPAHQFTPTHTDSRLLTEDQTRVEQAQHYLDFNASCIRGDTYLGEVSRTTIHASSSMTAAIVVPSIDLRPSLSHVDYLQRQADLQYAPFRGESVSMNRQMPEHCM